MENNLRKGRHLIVMMMACALLLLMASCTTDYWPTITSLKADADWTAPGGVLQVVCSVSAYNMEELTYQWSASGGTISGTGAIADWSAPQTVGMYDITVVVTNAQGRQATESVALTVSNGPPPTIEALIVTARDHKYLKEIATGYRAAREYDYDIECVASGPNGELLYQWSCSGGQLVGEGSTVMWKAPDADGPVTVTAKVSDSAGNWVRKSIAFQVVDCEACVVW
ncbi:MAG: Ig domain-containing protein [Dehalococcoidia bacterium]